MNTPLLPRLPTVVTLSLLAAFSCYAQISKPALTSNEKAEKIIQKAVEAVGGNAYLAVQTVIGRGLYAEYNEGVGGVPVRFTDYISYPDRQRTEFTGVGIRLIQTNYKDAGWLFDSTDKTLKDQTPEQVSDFKRGLRTTVENVLRGWWRKEGAILSYVGLRNDYLSDRPNETVRLTYPDGFWIEYEFFANGLPRKIIYMRQRKNLSAGEMQEVKEEDRLSNQNRSSGVISPYTIDHYRNGVQTSKIFYQSMEFNKPLPDSLFAKPADIKAP